MQIAASFRVQGSCLAIIVRRSNLGLSRPLLCSRCRLSSCFCCPGTTNLFLPLPMDSRHVHNQRQGTIWPLIALQPLQRRTHADACQKSSNKSRSLSLRKAAGGSFRKWEYYTLQASASRDPGLVPKRTLYGRDRIIYLSLVILERFVAMSNLNAFPLGRVILLHRGPGPGTVRKEAPRWFKVRLPLEK